MTDSTTPRRAIATASRFALALVVALAALTACHPTSSDSTAADAKATNSASAASSTGPSDASATPSSATDVPANAPSPAAPTPGDASNASLPEPQTPPGVASPQAAATVVETYFALVDSGKTNEADALWGDARRAAQFRMQLDKLGKPHAQVFAPGPVEGAAGSMYVTVPIELGATDNAANSRPRKGEVTLRRVNDVPGSTEAQRRWHIDHIDVAMTPK